jgi:hypothetical protein
MGKVQLRTKEHKLRGDASPMALSLFVFESLVKSLSETQRRMPLASGRSAETSFGSASILGKHPTTDRLFAIADDDGGGTVVKGDIDGIGDKVSIAQALIVFIVFVWMAQELNEPSYHIGIRTTSA